MKIGIGILICIALYGCDLVERNEVKNPQIKNQENIEPASDIDSTRLNAVDSAVFESVMSQAEDTVNISLLEVEDEFEYVYTTELKSGVKIKWIERNTGAKIRSDEMLLLEYRLSLPDGRIIDGNNKMKMPYVPFVVGYNMQQKGWDLALKEMCVGDVAKIEIPSQLAYGAKGLGSIIPPNTDNWLFLKIHGVVNPDYDLKYFIGIHSIPKHSPFNLPLFLWCILCALLIAKKYLDFVFLNTLIL